MITYLAIMAVALICYRLDQRKRDSGESDKRGAPWSWEDWQ